MRCEKCELLNKVEIECVRRLDAAQSRLRSFFPEPPYGKAAVDDLHSREREVEEARSALETATRERAAHSVTHALTVSR